MSLPARPRGGATANGAALAYAAALAAFILVPPFLKAAFGAYPSLRWGDMVDLLTPLVVMPAAWILFAGAGASPPSRRATIAFVLIAAAWVEGQGMHLAANAISNLQVESGGGPDELTHFLDEVLSHYIWHAALVGLSVLVLLRATGARNAFTDWRGWSVLALAAAMYGFTFFATVVEGGTGPLGVPAAVGLAVAGGVLWRRTGSGIAALFGAGYALASVLFLAWAAMNGWQLREFTDAGLL